MGELDPVERINIHPVATSSRTGKTNEPLPRLFSNSSDEALVVQIEDVQHNSAFATSDPVGSLGSTALLRLMLKPSLMPIGSLFESRV